MSNPMEQVLELVKQAKALSQRENILMPRTEAQMKIVEDTLNKLKAKPVKHTIKYKTVYDFDEPAYYEGSGNTPFGYSQDGEDN